MRIARRPELLFVARPWLWWTPFLMILSTSVVSTAQSETGLVGVSKLTLYLGLGLFISVLLVDELDARLIVASLLVAALFLGSVGALEVTAGLPSGFRRADSLIGSNPLGLLGGFAACVAIVCWRKLTVAWRAAAVLAATTCLISGASVGAVLGTSLAIIAFAAIAGGGARRGRRVLIVAAGILVMAGSLGVSRYSDFAAGLGQGGGLEGYSPGTRGGTLLQRAMYADFGVRIWLADPLTGVGYLRSSEPEVWGPHLDAVRSDFFGLITTYFPDAPDSAFGLHNVYLQLLAESGLLGLAAFALALWKVVAPVRSSLGSNELALLALTWMVLVLTHSLEHGLQGGVPETVMLALALGLCCSSVVRVDRHSCRA